MFADPPTWKCAGHPSSTIVRHSGAHSSAAQSPPGGWCGSTAPRRPRAARGAGFGDGAIGVVARDVGHPDQAVGRVRAEVGEPVVVRGVAGPGELRVATRERRAHGGAEEDLGVDAVDVLVLHARAGLPPAGADLVEAAHAHRVFLGATAGGCRERHHRAPLSLEHLEIALVGPLDRRRPVAELRGEVLAPTSPPGGFTCESADTARNAASVMTCPPAVVRAVGPSSTRP